MVDAIVENARNKNMKLLIAAFVLGIATSIRVLGPLAGLLVVIYSLARLPFSKWKSLIVYGVTAIFIMLLTWPYLWENPIANFLGVFRFMSDNPTNLSVLFNGQAYRAGELPLSYLPFMLVTTLTEPVWILFFLGLITGYWKMLATPKDSASNTTPGTKEIISLNLILSWFVILLAYALLRRPAMYDGFRHFLFILPPVFIFIGFAFEVLFDRINIFARSKEKIDSWLRAGAVMALLAPGILGVIQLHPYEYTYYNSFIGGTEGAFRKYETDYWLTCYKEAVAQLNGLTSEPINLFVKREAYVAAPYAKENITVRDLRDMEDSVRSGDYVLINTRLNDDRSTFKDAPVLLTVKRGNATFCIVRQIP